MLPEIMAAVVVSAGVALVQCPIMPAQTFSLPSVEAISLAEVPVLLDKATYVKAKVERPASGVGPLVLPASNRINTTTRLRKSFHGAAGYEALGWCKCVIRGR